MSNACVKKMLAESAALCYNVNRKQTKNSRTVLLM